jgi:hypothetical protein
MKGLEFLKIKNRVLALASSLVLTFTVMPHAQADSIFTSSERVFYFLDVSDSADSQKLWTLLRASLLEKVDVALGYPKRPGIVTPVKPTDLSVSVINDNSQAAQIVEVLSVKDAEKIWGLIITKIGGGNPTAARLKAITTDFFGPTGTYTVLVAEYALQDEITAPSTADCQKRANSEFSKGNFMKNVPAALRSDASKETCKIITKLLTGIKSADELFKTNSCVKNAACSDVVGAVKRTVALAADLAKQSTPKSVPKLCIAIASDMLNAYPGMSATSAWNTSNVVRKSANNSGAEALGRQVAEEAAIKFSSKVNLRVEVIGQGASQGFPRELTSKLDSYWGGFWSAAGVKSSAQRASLDQACK